MSDLWSLGPPPRNLSIPFPAPAINANSSSSNGLNKGQCQANGTNTSSQERVAGADVTLNPDGSITVANLKDGRGQPHTVYLPYQRQIVPGHNLRVYIDGLPLNPISHEHLWLAQRAREIGCDTQLRSELKKLARHELESLEALADALVAGREPEARSIFRRFRHSQHEGTNNFFKLAPPLRTLLLIRKTPAGSLIDNSISQLRMTYTVNSQGAVLSVYFDKKGIHIWDR